MGPKLLLLLLLGLVEEEEEIHQDGTLGESSSLDSVNSGSPLDTSQDKKSRPWIWGAVFLLGLLVMVAVVLLAVMVKRKGNRFAVGGQFQSSGISNTAPSSADHHISDSGLAVDLPSDVPYVKLDSPPSFDDTTYTNLPPDSLSGKLLPLEAPSVAPLPPKVEISSKPVTYATVIFPGKGKSGGAAGEPAQEPPNSQAPPS
ncbi:trem-like transcript 1 protein isoform X2 [Capricornis sumatraensis]|uniref:trem-like transcript 1 protein isoform X2 n=1 Tax=Capricornis sumatraensis TaxID=34865 RepID=UPI0036049A96